MISKLVMKLIKLLLPLLEEKHTLCRQKYLEEIAWSINKYPRSKIDVLRVLRLDGKSLADALQMYNDWNGIKE